MFALLQIIIIQTLAIHVFSQATPYVYSASCEIQSVSPRICPYTNITQYLLTIKKGGTQILSTQPYDPNFFLCQQYNYDCGYLQNQLSPIKISNGIPLTMTPAQLDAILPTNATLANKIKPFLGLTGQTASCGMGIYPLVLAPSQSTLVFNNYMSRLSTKVTSQYTSQRTAQSAAYSDLNINIKTSVLETVKANPEWQNESSQYWEYFVNNQFTNMSDYLKDQYAERDQQYLLHSAYLLDSVSAQCNRYQAVNFLVDQSGSITAGPFALAIQFLLEYVGQTKDDLSLMSVNFYSTSFQQYIGYGKDKATIQSMLRAKPYPGGGTLTGSAINKTVLFIKGANLPTGLPKVLIVLTDGNSYDDVILASNYARNNGISLIAVGIGPNVNQSQLLQIAQTPSNMILISSYSQLKLLVDYLSNYICKQTVTISLGQKLQQNKLKVPTSPNYYRIQKDTTNHLMLQINYQTDPILSQQEIYQSQIDPFPDTFTQYQNTAYSTSALKKTIFIQPTNQASFLMKKNVYNTTTVKTSYLSIGANQLSFNATLSTCATPDCSAQRLAAGVPVGSTGRVGSVKGRNDLKKINKQDKQDRQEIQNSKENKSFQFSEVILAIFCVSIVIGSGFMILCLKKIINSRRKYIENESTFQNADNNKGNEIVQVTFTQQDIKISENEKQQVNQKDSNTQQEQDSQQQQQCQQYGQRCQNNTQIHYKEENMAQVYLPNGQ